MSHLDPEQIALLALGEPVASEAERAHIAECSTCAEELAALTRAVAVGRSTSTDAGLETPPPAVWDRIAAETGIGTPDTSAIIEPAPATRASRSAPARLQRRGRRRGGMWALAASAALILTVGGVWAATSLTGRVDPIATAALGAFPAHPDADGSAAVTERSDGSRSLTVTLDTPTPADHYREVWLIRNDGGALISLGVIDGPEATLTIPNGLDLREYGLVDVSVEPLNGDPAHSGDSIVRGPLDFA